jgi:hypothetical protein
MNSSDINFRDSISPSESKIQNLAKSVHLGKIEEFIVSDSDSSISGSSSRESIASSSGSSSGSRADTRNNSFSSDLNSSIVLLPSDAIDRDIVDNLTNLNLDKQTDDSQKSSTLIERKDGVDDIDKSLNEVDDSFGESEPVPDPVPEPIETLPSSSIQPLEPKTIVPRKNIIIELALSYKKYVKLIADLGIYQVFDDRKVCFQVTPNKTGEKTTYKCSRNFAKTCVHIMAVEAANGRNLYEEIRYSKPKLDDLIRFRHDNKLSGRKMSGHVKNTTSLSKPDSIAKSGAESEQQNEKNIVENSSKKKLPYLSNNNKAILNLIVSSSDFVDQCIASKTCLSTHMLILDQTDLIHF